MNRTSLSILLFVALCVPSTAESIRVGVVLPLTGPITVYGNQVLQAVQEVVDATNAGGGIDGRAIELIVRDDEFKPEKTLDAAKDLIEKQKVVAIVGSLTSNCTLAATNYVQQRQVPMLTPSSTNDQITDAGDFLFQVCYSDSFEGAVMARFAVETLKARSALVIYDSREPFSAGHKLWFRETFLEGKGRVHAFTAVNDKEGRALALSVVRTYRPDVVYLPLYYSDFLGLAKHLRANGFTGSILGSDVLEEALETNEPALRNVYYNVHFSPLSTVANQQRYVQRFQAAHQGSTPNALSALGNDAAQILIDALRAVAVEGVDLTPQSLQTALSRIEGRYVTGQIRFRNGATIKSGSIMRTEVATTGTVSGSFVISVDP